MVSVRYVGGEYGPGTGKSMTPIRALKTSTHKFDKQVITVEEDGTSSGRVAITGTVVGASIAYIPRTPS